MDEDEIRRLIGRSKGHKEQLETIAEVGLSALAQLTSKGDAARFSALFFEWVRDGSPSAVNNAAALLSRLPSADQRDIKLSVFASVIRFVGPQLPDLYRDPLLAYALEFAYRVGSVR
jgi:hypothetical protein